MTPEQEAEFNNLVAAVGQWDPTWGPSIGVRLHDVLNVIGTGADGWDSSKEGTLADAIRALQGEIAKLSAPQVDINALAAAVAAHLKLTAD